MSPPATHQEYLWSLNLPTRNVPPPLFLDRYGRIDKMTMPLPALARVIDQLRSQDPTSTR
jgi:hypothetical protein